MKNGVRMAEFNGKVESIETKVAKNNNPFWIVHIDGKKYATFNKQVATGFSVGDNVKVTGENNSKTGYFDVSNIEQSDEAPAQAPAQQSSAPEKSQQSGSQDLNRQILAELKALNDTTKSMLLHVQKLSEKEKSENGD